MNLRHAYVTCMLRARHVRTTRVSCARHVHIMYASCACHVRACARVRACVRACVVGGCALARDRSMPWMVSEFVRRADDSSLRPNRAKQHDSRAARSVRPVRPCASFVRECDRTLASLSPFSLPPFFVSLLCLPSLSLPSRVLPRSPPPPIARSRDRGLLEEERLVSHGGYTAVTRRLHGGYAAAVPSPRSVPPTTNERTTHARTHAPRPP